MGNLATTLTASQDLLFRYAEALLKDVPADKFARFPEGKHGPINTNHPAFLYGHMSLYPAKTLAAVGVTDGGVPDPAGFADLFAAGKECRDDPDGTIYPAMEVITAHFFGAHRAMFAKLAELTDEHLSKPHGLESDFAKRFPTRAAFAAFLVGPHPFTHIGQMSVWRRCMGLPGAF
ncbi:MAG TPA: hypothetical protein VFF69_02370 [Phycisphaerales bacterium]|nr:hypothetical protein [Phycisphaerales bacterium]